MILHYVSISDFGDYIYIAEAFLLFFLLFRKRLVVTGKESVYVYIACIISLALNNTLLVVSLTIAGCKCTKLDYSG